MDCYTIQEVSNLFHISKQTLRYYETVGLLAPKRGGNRYRHYDENDINELRYIQVMKYGGFTLKEIRTVLRNKSGLGQAEQGKANTLEIIAQRKRKMMQTISLLKELTRLADSFSKALAEKESSKEMDELVEQIYQNMEKKGN